MNEYDNTICPYFRMDGHESLENIIADICIQYGADFKKLKQGKRVCKDNNNLFWTEEHMTCILHTLYMHLPIPNKVDWLMQFLGRTRIQVRNILAIHYREMYSEGKTENYSELYWNYHYPISEYFLK